MTAPAPHRTRPAGVAAVVSVGRHSPACRTPLTARSIARTGARCGARCAARGGARDGVRWSAVCGEGLDVGWWGRCRVRCGVWEIGRPPATVQATPGGRTQVRRHDRRRERARPRATLRGTGRSAARPDGRAAARPTARSGGRTGAPLHGPTGAPSGDDAHVRPLLRAEVCAGHRSSAGTAARRPDPGGVRSAGRCAGGTAARSGGRSALRSSRRVP